MLGATVILGTGSGIAFFMLMAHLSGDPPFVARTAAVVVTADMVFTAVAIILQPITGVILMAETGAGLGNLWLGTAIVLYVVAGLAWLPVIAIQVRMRDLAHRAAAQGEPLPPAYHRLFRQWVLLGIPGFASVMAILWLMVAKPGL